MDIEKTYGAKKNGYPIVNKLNEVVSFNTELELNAFLYGFHTGKDRKLNTY